MRTFEIDPQAVKTFMLKRILLSSLWTLVICCGIVQAQSSQERPSKKLLRTEIVSVIDERTSDQNTEGPNVLFILADDQSPFDLRVYDPESKLETPNLDRLAKEGLVIERAYHMGSFLGAVCVPSRYMLMSGRSLWRLPISPRFKELGLDASALHSNTLASVFGAAGYSTMRTCKVGNSYEEADRLFSIRHDATKRGATDESGSAWHADRVVEYLDQRKADTNRKPFLIFLGFSHPHDERDGKPELLEKYGATNHTDPDQPPPLNDRQPPLPINYLPKHPFPDGHPELRDEVAVSGVWKHRDEATIRNEIGRNFACAENIDIQVGRVLDRLRQSGELSNTYVIYTSDHGMAIGRHGLQGKQNLYEHTWRVPMIVSGPGIQPGRRAIGNVYLMDVFATLCQLAGVDVPSSNEGMSFRRVLNGERESIRETIYGAYAGGTKPGIRCVKQGDWKLIQYDVLEGQVREQQLFNLSENPHELLIEHHALEVVRQTGNRPAKHQVNLAKDPRFAEQLAKMERLLAEQMEVWDDPFPHWNQSRLSPQGVE